MSRPRCPGCGRLTIPDHYNGTLPSLAGVKPYLVPLLVHAREFIRETEPGEVAGIIEFLDYCALEANRVKNAKPAGNPKQVGSRRRKAA